MTLRTLRLHVLSRMGISVCYSKVNYMRTKISTNARMKLMEVDPLFWQRAKNDPEVGIGLSHISTPLFDDWVLLLGLLGCWVVGFVGLLV